MPDAAKSHSKPWESDTLDPLPETQWGAVIWRVTAGTGEFQGATGYITSNNFTVSGTGEVVDNHYVRLMLP
jgi:hypothetical protein